MSLGGTPMVKASPIIALYARLPKITDLKRPSPMMTEARPATIMPRPMPMSA